MLSPEEMQTLEGTVRQLMAERKSPVMAKLIEHYWKDEPDNPVLAVWLIDVYLLGKRRNLGYRRNDRETVHARQLDFARKRLDDLKKSHEIF